MIEMLETPRLRLHRWHDRHRDAFARLHADPEVMADLGGPIDRQTSDRKLAEYRAAERMHGTSRWAVEDPSGRFLGYAGVMRRSDRGHPLGDHFEIGWRFSREAWGRGYASESAKAALRHATHDLGLSDVVAYTNQDNLRSQAVMARIGMIRDPGRDFQVVKPNRAHWAGLVWRLPPPDRLAAAD